MTHIWQSDAPGDDRIIAYHNHTIYCGSPKQDEIFSVVSDFERLQMPQKGFLDIPINYLRAVHLAANKNYIEVFFGTGSVQHLTISDAARREEVFGFFRQNLPRAYYEVQELSRYQAGKKPLMAMLVVFLLCVASVYVASEQALGYEYEVVGRPISASVIVLQLASLGIPNLLLLFGTLFAIALLAFIRKAKGPVIIEKLTIVR